MLGDFGLTMSTKQELAVSPVGTVEYMAPEVWPGLHPCKHEAGELSGLFLGWQVLRHWLPVTALAGQPGSRSAAVASCRLWHCHLSTL